MVLLQVVGAGGLLLAEQRVGTGTILENPASESSGNPNRACGEIGFLGEIIVLFQNFRFFLLDLCVGTAPQNLGTTPQIIGDHPLCRPLATLHLRGSRPGDPRFLLFVLFCFCFIFYYSSEASF